MKTLDKAIKMCDGMWEGMFKIINQQLNEVESLVNESIAKKKDDRKASVVFRKLGDIEKTIEAYRSETSTESSDKRELYKLRERKNKIYNKLVNMR